jgi:formylglycine-generating enzyme required for sulfatase activity
MAAAANRSVDIGFITLSNEPLNTGPLELPAELVFIPTIEEEIIRPIATPRRELTDAVFEDEEADDEFEQSLSGLRIENDETSEDVIEDAQQAGTSNEPIAIESTPIEESPTAVAEIAVPQPTVADQAIEEIAPEALVVVTSDPAEMPRRNGIVQFLVSLLSVIAAFAAGIVATMWWFGFPPPVPNAVDLPVAAAPQPSVSVPRGMVLVPGGEFVMGSNDGDAFSRPAHSVTVKSFFIDTTEVTNEAYLEFVQATDHAAPQNWIDRQFPAGQEKFPVTGVSWYEALEFAAWSGKRLPPEAEWEFAARGSEDRIYPWGNEWNTSAANVGAAKGAIREAGSGIASPYGVYDMAGNVWEWTASDAKSYPGGKQIPWSRLKLKVIRGGNFQSDSRTAASTFRGFYGATGEKEYGSTGFRCVKDLPKE